VQNLEERAKVHQIKEALSQVFSEYGNVIDIVAKTNLRAKGQAFIVFDKPESAQAALEDAQGFELFDKPMRLSMAKTRSDATIKALNSEDEFELHKRRRQAEKGEPEPFKFVEGRSPCWTLTHLQTSEEPPKLPKR
jgi:RNA recognition motif-containing protein